MKKKEKPYNPKVRFYRFCLYKAYFDKGYGLTHYLRYLILLFGMGDFVLNQQFESTLWLVIIWGLSCLPLGWAWYKFGFAEAEAEVGNRFNLFIKEMRGNRKLFGEAKTL